MTAPDEAAIRAAVRDELDARDRETSRRKDEAAREKWPFVVFGFTLAVWVVLWMALGYYDAVGASAGVDTIAKAARLDTVRNLASRGLVAWDGTAHDPERRAVPSERGRFVVRHGAPGAPPA